MLDVETGAHQAETPTRSCPHCSSLSQTTGDFCPHCGGRFGVGRGGMSGRVKVMIGLVCALLVLGGAGVAVAIKIHHDNQVASQHRQALAAARARAAAAAARIAAAQAAAASRQAQHQAEVTERQAMETQLQDAITKDATQKRTRAFC